MKKRPKKQRAKDELRPEYDLAKLKGGVRGKYAAPSKVIIKDPRVLGGEPVFRNTRVPFKALLDYLEGGQTLDEFLEDFPTVKPRSRNCCAGGGEKPKERR